MVVRGDFVSLARALESAGVQPTEIESLQAAIEGDNSSQETGLGSRTKAWIKNAAGAIARSSGKVATDVAATVLSKAVGSYLGLPP